jgi:hypothetical protein
LKKSRILKLSTLIDLGACSYQVKRFRKTFGESVRVTEKLCLSASDKFDWTWAASHLLSAPALAEYKRAMAPARAECERVMAPARAEYERVMALTWAEYERVRAPAYAEYERVMALAWAEYKRVIALAFARGYLS